MSPAANRTSHYKGSEGHQPFSTLLSADTDKLLIWISSDFIYIILHCYISVHCYILYIIYFYYYYTVCIIIHESSI